MKKIAVVTTTRADYGILRPLIFRLREEKDIRLQVIVTGMHLSPRYGYTKSEIEQDGVDIFREIPILEEGNSPFDISLTMAAAIKGFAGYFRDEKPDLVFVLGDRTEILGVCSAAMNEQVPIAHLHGGELTEGAVDECIRHAVTKMSYLHFAASEVYQRRIIQMGEQPERVFHVGALGVENIMKTPLLSYEDLCKEAGIPLGKKYVVVTFHPETLQDVTAERQVEPLLKVMERQQYFYLITKANADAGGDEINQLLAELERKTDHVRLVSSLGMVRYLSAVKYSEFVLGNSSSGVIEAPALGVPSVNIGERQRGRLMADTVIQCRAEEADILAAMQQAQRMERKVSGLYGDGTTSEKIVAIVNDFLDNDKIDLKKKFFDLEFSW